MKQLVTSSLLALLVSGYTATSSAETWLETLCGDPDSKDYCTMMITGYISGFSTARLVAEREAETGVNVDFCMPRGESPKDQYEAVLPQLKLDIEYVDIALLSALLAAYPCEDE